MSDRPSFKQVLIAVCLLGTAVLPLAGCGKRAGMVDPPPDGGPSIYAHPYPDAETDPAPTYHAP